MVGMRNTIGTLLLLALSSTAVSHADRRAEENGAATAPTPDRARQSAQDRSGRLLLDHLTARRQGGELRQFVNGRLAATSVPFDAKDYDLTVAQPLKIGFGEHDFFTGRIREVRVYRRALSEREVAVLQETDRP